MKFLTVFILLLCSSASNGQVVQEYLFSNDVKSRIEKQLSEGTNLWNLQNYAVQYSFTGRYNESITTHNLFLEKNRQQVNAIAGPKADASDLEGFAAVDAVPLIAKTSEQYQIVITNEAHYQPQNRVFTISLLKALYDKGFRYLAAEDFAVNDKVYKKSEDTDLNRRGFAVKKSGYYISEPQYGNLTRTALKLGYTLVPYDYFGSEIKDPLKRFEAREAGQARNLAAILKKDPKAKVLVHSGYGHLNEYLNSEGSGLMGAMLKKNHDIDPLTIDQTTYLPEKKSLYSETLSIKTPSILVNSEGTPFSPQRPIIQADFKVFFPRTEYVAGRPNWLFYADGRRFYFPNLKNSKLTFPVLLKAYVKDEPIEEAIPADVIELANSNDKTGLVLEKGNYQLIITSIDGTTQSMAICVK